MKNYALSLIFILISTFVGSQIAQSSKFKNFDVTQFDCKKISFIVWDGEGHFWGATDKGLITFDGYQATFFTEKDKNSILSNRITAIEKINDDEIWFSYIDRAMLTKLTPSTKTFEHYELPEIVENDQLIAFVVTIKQSLTGEYWLGTWGKGLIKFNPEGKNTLCELSKENINGQNVRQFIKDFTFVGSDSLFLTFFNENHKAYSYPGYYNIKTKTFDSIPIPELVAHHDPVVQSRIEKASTIIHFVHQDQYENFWLGSYSGVLHYDVKKGEINRIMNNSDDPSLQNLENAINYAVSKDKIWVGTINKGLMSIDFATKKVKYFQNDPDNSRSIANNRITNVSADPLGNIWVGNGSDVVSVQNPYIENFKLLLWKNMDLEFTNRSAQNIPVNQILVKSAEEVFVSTKKGLLQFNCKDYSLTKSTHFKTLKSDKIHELGTSNFKQFGNKLLLFYDGFPVWIDLKNDKVKMGKKSISLKLLFKHDSKINDINLIHYASSKNFGRIVQIDSNFNITKVRYSFKDINLGNKISLVTKQNNWLISEFYGRFAIFNPRDSSLKYYTPSSKEYYFPDSTLRSACLDPNSDEILIGTNFGLYSFNETTGKSVNISEKVGLKKNEPVNSIVFDNNGVLWMALNREIHSWNPKTNMSKRYDKNMGVDASNFLPSVGQIDELGKIYFVSMNGLFVFHPDKIQPPKNLFSTNLFNLKVNDVAITSSELTTFLAGNKTFASDENYLEFYLNTNQVFQLSPHQFSYKLEGLNNRWVNNGSSNLIRFDNLRYGKYKLLVKCENSFGNESDILEIPFVIKKPFWATVWFYIIIGVAVILLSLLVINYRLKTLKKRQVELELEIKKATSEIREQKEYIEEAHREITDSINYAERIQRSFLATNDILNNHLNEYFVFFQPKDIVSGDFYWSGELSNGNFAIACADSTGHGVPGAIMSILNISSIEKAVEKGISKPANIFSDTRKTIIERLKKDGSKEGGKDGMDASIVSFNQDKTVMEYCAAYNPIWIIRPSLRDTSRQASASGLPELIEIKPEKMPVGKHDHDHIPFEGGSFDLQKGDIVYMITDGFQDQFGGEKGKKFKVKPMKRLLLENAHLPMNKQKELLSKTLESWKGELEQVDDVCIFGIKID